MSLIESQSIKANKKLNISQFVLTSILRANFIQIKHESTICFVNQIFVF